MLQQVIELPLKLQKRKNCKIHNTIIKRPNMPSIHVHPLLIITSVAWKRVTQVLGYYMNNIIHAIYSMEFQDILPLLFHLSCILSYILTLCQTFLSVIFNQVTRASKLVLQIENNSAIIF